MARSVGLNAVYVTGKVRTYPRGQPRFYRALDHAWNAVEIDGTWHFLDITWDAGVLSGGRFTPQYRTDYLFAPASVFSVDHFPDHPAFRRSADVSSVASFESAPYLKPSFAMHNLVLESPRSYYGAAPGRFEIVVRNPLGHELIGRWHGEKYGLCTATHAAPLTRIVCEVTEHHVAVVVSVLLDDPPPTTSYRAYAPVAEFELRRR
jgi:hypothetical protein